MVSSSPRAAPRTTTLLALLAVYGVVALWNTPRRDFWGDETGHALVTRQMERGTPQGWLIPSLDGKEPYLAKPPLSYWLPALTHVVTGLELQLSYRMPAVLLALLGLWLTFHLGKRLFDGAIAFLAMSIQATSWLFFVNSAWLGSELQFAVFCQMSLTGFVLAAREKDGRLWRVVGWAGLAGAALTESLPLAALLVFGTLLCYFFFRGGVSAVQQGVRSGWKKGSVVFFLLLTAPWYAAATALHGGEFLQQHLLTQHVQRLMGAADSPQPAYYYLLVLPLVFLPWTLFVPLGLYHGKDRLSRPGQRLCTIWSVFVVVVLTLLSSKRAVYLLPLWPALALLIPAAFFETEEKFSLWEGYLGHGIFRIVPHLLKVPLIFALILAGCWFTGVFNRYGLLDPAVVERLEEPENRLQPIYLLVLAVVAGAGAFWTSYRVRNLLESKEVPRAAFETACATLFLFFVATFFAPVFNPVKSARPFLDHVSREIKKAPVATYGKLRPAEVLYYLEREVRHFPHLDPEAAEGSEYDAPRRQLLEYLKGNQPAYLFTSREELAGLRHHFPKIYRSEGKSLLKETNVRGTLGSRGEYVLLVSR